MRLTSLFLLAATTPALALDLRPATLHLTATDPAGLPLANATVTQRRANDPAAQTLTATTDAAGHATLQQPAPALTWTADLTLDKPGLPPIHTTVRLFTHAALDLDLRADPARTTTLTFLDADGHPFPHLPFRLNYATNRGDGWDFVTRTADLDQTVTDDAGRYIWNHPPLVRDFSVTVAHRVQRSPDVPDLSVRLTPAETRLLRPAASLQLTLLNPDGSPAKDWLVATDPERAGGFGVINGGIAIEINTYSVRRWQPVAKGGSAALESPRSILLLMSPQGLPLLYTLNPQAWPAGPHLLTLTLPPITQTLTGRIIDSDERPVADLPLVPNAMASAPFVQYRVLAPAAPNAAAIVGPFPDGPQPAQIRTANDGSFTIPLHAGMTPTNWTVGPPSFTLSRYLSDQPGVTHPLILRSYADPAATPANLKDVTIAFLDPDGHPLDAAHAPLIHELTASPGETNRTFGSAFIDARGAHYFLNKNATTLHFTLNEDLWRSATYDLPLSGDDEQTLPVQLLADQRNPPLSGRVLDADNHPVAGARISLHDPAPAQPLSAQPRNLSRLHTTTDAGGRYAFAAAPETCTVALAAANVPYLPPLPVTPDKRTVDFHLPPTGAARILLPASFPDITRFVGLLPNDPAAAGTSVFELHFDAPSHTLTTDTIPTGSYHLRTEDFPELAGYPGDTVAITSNQTTTLDYRHNPLAPTPPTRDVTLTVTRNGQPFPGAEVAVFADDGPNGLKTLTLDLADPQGQIHFTSPSRQPCIALARVRGQFQGLLEFTLPAEAIFRPLLITLDPVPPPAPGPRMYRPPAPDASFRERALFRQDDLLWGDRTWGVLR